MSSELGPARVRLCLRAGRSIVGGNKKRLQARGEGANVPICVPLCGRLPVGGRHDPDRMRRVRRGRLSHAHHHAGGAFPAGRRGRHAGARRRAETIRSFPPAGRGRQPGRRRRNHRHARRRAGGAGRLHAAARPHRNDLDQSESLRSRRARPAQGFHAGRPDRLDAGCAAGQSVVPGQDRGRFHRHGKEGSGQVQSRHLGASAPAATCAPNCSRPNPASTLRSFPTREPLP